MVQSLIDEPKKLLELINSCLKPKKLEKKKFGEVFTPMSLVNEMLDKLDEYYIKENKKSIFEEKEFKWLDPANGMGNYPIAVYYRLMKGLKNKIKNKEERKKHILENMLYMAELNKKNVFICKQIFNIENKYKLNLYCGDSLQLNTEKEWNVKEFDIIVGNPPYQKSTTGTRKGGYGGRSLWDKFVILSLDKLLKNNGYLVFIHPPSWRKPEHKLWNKMTQENQILYLKLFTEQLSSKIFNCSTLVDYYIIKKKNIYTNTILFGQDKQQYNINLKEWKFLPSGKINIIKKILGKNKIIYSSSLYDTRRKYILQRKKKEIKEEYYKRCKEQKYNYPIIHNMTKAYGNGYVYSYINKGHFGIKKVVLSFGRYQYPYNDYKGEYGMSQICYGLKIKNKKEGNNIVKAINSNKFKEVLKYTKWSTFQTDWRMFKYFKKDFWKEFI